MVCAGAASVNKEIAIQCERPKEKTDSPLLQIGKSENETEENRMVQTHAGITSGSISSIADHSRQPLGLDLVADPSSSAAVPGQRENPGGYQTYRKFHRPTRRHYKYFTRKTGLKSDPLCIKASAISEQ